MSATLRDGPTAQGTMHEGPLDCPGGGNITMDASWTDDPNAYMGMRDLQMTITASNCVESPYTMNGTLTMTFSGTLDAPTGFTLSAPNSRFADASYPFDITMSGFSMAMTNITYSGGMVTGATATFNGSVTGNVDAESINEGFQDFRMVFSETAAGFSYSLSGSMRASCLGSGWVTVSTPTPISGPSTALCPTGGEVVMTAGSDTVNAVIYPDYSIEVYFNGTPAHTYADCDALTGAC